MNIRKSDAKCAKSAKTDAKETEIQSSLRVCLRALRVFASLGSVLSGCAIQHPPSSQPSVATSAPVTTGGQIHSDKGGFDISAPPKWKSIDKGGDFAEAFVPVSASGDDVILAVQVPTLPPHIPGFLPLGGVADGYVNDLKKRYPDEKVDEKSQATLDGANGRHITSSFQKDGKPFREVALLSVHGDHVYVITVTCPSDRFDESQSAFNQLTSSWKWKS